MRTNLWMMTNAWMMPEKKKINRISPEHLSRVVNKYPGFDDCSWKIKAERGSEVEWWSLDDVKKIPQNPDNWTKTEWRLTEVFVSLQDKPEGFDYDSFPLLDLTGR